MLRAKDKYELYDRLKYLLQKNDFVVNPFRDINYGIQFLVSFNTESELLRVYEGKKGLRIDYSQIKNDAFVNAIQKIIDDTQEQLKPVAPLFDPNEKDVERLPLSDPDPDDLIGVDESGKGDYFGPLVVAAVRVDPAVKERLEGLGIQDSKKLTDKKIDYLAHEIMSRCQHTLIIMGNESYNDIYSKFQNLNHILAWGHMKVIEDNLKQGYCPNVLCDQFANASLLKNSLRAKKLDVTLYQRPRAESNIAVACASILARYHFVDQLKKMSAAYELNFPKGCSKKVIEVAQEFVDKYGMKALFTVAKTHFNVTDQLEDPHKEIN